MKLKKLQQFKKEMKGVRLPSEEKNLIKNNLISFIRTNPVRKNTNARLINQTQRLFLFFTQKHMYASIATILVLLTGTGTAFAAENTLPGDTLYPVKLHINESVRGAVALTHEARANWETKVAERRLDEASKLESKGKLSPETEAKIEARLEAQTKKIKARIEKLEEKGNTEAAANMSARLENALELHEQLLEKLKSSEDLNKEEIKPLVKKLHSEVNNIREIRVKLDEKVDTKNENGLKESAENRMENSQKHIAQVKEYFEDHDIQATSSASIKLELAIKTQSEGKAKFEAGQYKEAFTLFVTAQRLSHEAKLMAQVNTNLKSDPRVEKIFKEWDEKKEMRINLEKKIQLNEENRQELKEKLNERFER